jgi:PAS domain S-box-containing protein
MDRLEDPDLARILIVDDHPENLVALEAILQPLGYPLIRAGSGQEALREVLRHEFAVILLDVQMPGLNGFETANLIKARERSSHTPIIFLTAISKEEEYVFEGYSAGAVDYMFKPFNPSILRSKVAVFVDLYLKNLQLRQQAELLKESELREMELQHRARLVESEARYADVVNAALEGILTFGEDRRIALFNSAAEHIFGIPEEAAAGTDVGRFFPELGPTEELVAEDDGTPEGSTAREGVGRREDGTEFPVEYSLSRLVQQGGAVYTMIVRDISERRQAEEAQRAQAASLANTTEELRVLNDALNHRTVELERAMGARSRFYANMSHELRTPINAILGYTSLLLDRIYGPLKEQQVTSIDRTHKAAEHLLELVNDILDLSKIEAGKMELQVESLHLPELLQDLFVTVAPVAEQHEVELSMEGRSEPFTVVSDARRVRQILLNLLSNAIKFGGGKPVRAVWSAREGGGLVVEVVDQGSGIAPEDQEKIFDEFVQLEQQQNALGTGLGLPISRRLAELLGGELTVNSAPGAGSTFRLSLPPIDLEESESRPPERMAVGS